jgi:hypothetical protein
MKARFGEVKFDEGRIRPRLTQSLPELNVMSSPG